MDQRDAINAWRELFRGKRTTHDILAAAEVLLNSLSGESPLHRRLANELEEKKRSRQTNRKSELAAKRQSEQRVERAL